MNKQKKLTLTFIALLVLAIVIAGIALLVKRYMPSNRGDAGDPAGSDL